MLSRAVKSSFLSKLEIKFAKCIILTSAKQNDLKARRRIFSGPYNSRRLHEVHELNVFNHFKLNIYIHF